MKILILSLMICLTTAVYGQDAAGVIKKKEGIVDIIRNGVTIPANVGDKVLQGDMLSTGKDSGVGISMKDESRMSVGGNSKLALEKFKFNPSTNNGSIIVSIAKGTFAMVSGLITKHNKESALIKTPTTTAGIRGTTFVVEVP